MRWYRHKGMDLPEEYMRCHCGRGQEMYEHFMRCEQHTPRLLQGVKFLKYPIFINVTP